MTESTPNQPERFDAIEGLRAWLAWAVVGWHVLQFTGAYRHVRILGSSAGIAHLAVEMFIIVSGFVVCHLVVTRPERWSIYIRRRAFRLFPAYLVVLLAGAITTGLAASALPLLPWHADPAWDWRETFLAEWASQQAHPFAHGLLHLSLLQGTVPDTVLPFSAPAMLGPAWSLSLEWQFYLIAPFLVAGLRRPARAAAILALLALVAAAWHSGLMGTYRLMSAFPLAAHLFLTGILSRLGYAQLAAFGKRSWWLVAPGILLGLAFPVLAAIGAWLAFLPVLPALARGDDARPGLVRQPAAAARALFAGSAARWLGVRSYCVYLVHWPLVELALWAGAGRFSADQRVAAVELLTAVVPLTLLCAEILHRAVELPAIALGKRLSGKRPAARHQTSPDLAASAPGQVVAG